MIIYSCRDEIEEMFNTIIKNVCDKILYCYTDSNHIYKTITQFTTPIFVIIQLDRNSFRLISKESNDSSQTTFSLLTMEKVVKKIFEIVCLPYLGVYKKTLTDIDIKISRLVINLRMIYNICFDYDKDDLDHVIEEIIREMIKSTRLYRTFESQSIDVTTHVTDPEFEQYSIESCISFYNGDKYAPKLKISYTNKHSEFNLVEALQNIVTLDSKSFTEDQSCGFVLLYIEILREALNEINNILREKGYNVYNVIDSDLYEVMIDNRINIDDRMSLREEARHLVLKGIIGYLKKYKNQEGYDEKDWNEILLN